jgi:hypothetical protein
MGEGFELNDAEQSHNSVFTFAGRVPFILLQARGEFFCGDSSPFFAKSSSN